jgi:hypothetical protein
MFAGFVTRPGPDDVMGEDSAQKDADGAALIGLQPGTMQLLLPGEDIKFSDPADVGSSYEAFQYRTLLACCSAMGVPYTNVTGDLRQANYSSLAAFGIDAVYTPAGGEPVPVRLIAKRQDTIVGFGETRIHTETATFELRASEVASPRPGDQLTVGAETFVVQGEPERRDPDQLVWNLDTRSV